MPAARAAPPSPPVPPPSGAGGDRRPARVPTTAKGRATRGRLVEAAVACFAANGYHATAVADITAAAGTSHGNFYRYFDNVDDVLVAAVEPVLERLLESARCGDPADATSLDALVRWQTGYLQAYAPDRVLIATMREATAIDRGEGFTVAWRGLRARFVREVERWIGHVTDQLGADPSGVPPEAAAEALACMTEQLAYVNLGLATADPDPDLIVRLGAAAGHAYYRSVVAPRK